jgi:adenine specific DNA methylase Mod
MRSNVFSFKTCQKFIQCEVEGSANTANVNSCQKPMRLIMRLIHYFSREGNNILDLCSGTGTTAAACLLLNRSLRRHGERRFQSRIMPARVTGAITHTEENSHDETKRVSLHRVTISADGVENVTEIEL